METSVPTVTCCRSRAAREAVRIVTREEAGRVCRRPATLERLAEFLPAGHGHLEIVLFGQVLQAGQALVLAPVDDHNEGGHGRVG